MAAAASLPRSLALALSLTLPGAGMLLAAEAGAPAAPLGGRPSLAALIQRQGRPLAGGRVEGGVRVPLERAAGGDTPVLSFRATLPGAGAAHSVRLLLDTGASATMITPSLAGRLGLHTSELPPGAFDLAGGGSGCRELRPRLTRLPELRLTASSQQEHSGLRLQGAEALVLPVAGLPAGIDGVLGVPSLRLLPILIDPAGGRLVLGAEADAAFHSFPGGGRPVIVPLRWRQGVPVFQVSTTAGPVKALADSGAEGLFLSPSLAQRLPVGGTPQPLRLVGVCGEQGVERRLFSGLSLPAPERAGRGPKEQTRWSVEGIVTDNPVFEALGVELIAGQEWLRGHRQLWHLEQEPALLWLR
ncbi:MAG: aspartyl protease family protein [Cyanobium sp.]